MSNWMQRLEWLPAGDPRNPLPFDVIDCREACAALAASTRGEAMLDAMQAVERSITDSSPRSFIGDSLSPSNLPEIRFGSTPPEFLSPRALTATDNWRLEVDDERIFAIRRWTGQLVHIAQVQSRDGHWIVSNLISQSSAVYGAGDYAAAEMEFLLRSYFERSISAFPAPPGLTRRNMREIALAGWKAHGGIAQFGRLL